VAPDDFPDPARTDADGATARMRLRRFPRVPATASAAGRRAALTGLVLTALVVGLLAPAGPSAADGEKRRKARVDSAMRDLRHEMNETSRELKAAAAALDRAESKLPGARRRVARVHGRLVAAQARDRMIGEQLAVAEAEVERAEDEIEATLEEIAASEVLIGRIARSTYQDGGMGELAVVLESKSPDDFATRLVLVQNALRSEGNVLGELAEAKADLAALRATLEAKRQQLAAMKREQEKIVRQIQRLEAKAVKARERVEALIAEREIAVAAVEREKAAEEDRYARMQAESQRLSRILAARARKARLAAARARAAGRSTSGGGALSWPVSAYVTSGFGMRTHPVTGVYKLHDGTDFGANCGTPVRAAAGGTVIQAANVPGYGNQLVIDHGAMRGAGVATSYSHLMSFRRGYGSRISRGEVIGYSGGAEGMYGAGYSTGCHLHFMVYVNGGPTDPMGWL
jgi:murein DD-endopeptidase MepM/ murein hydrolase activator NlpD